MNVEIEGELFALYTGTRGACLLELGANGQDGGPGDGTGELSAVVAGDQVVQMIVLYIEPTYRLGLLVQFAPSNAQTMGSVLAPLMFNGVVIK